MIISVISLFFTNSYLYCWRIILLKLTDFISERTKSISIRPSQLFSRTFIRWCEVHIVNYIISHIIYKWHIILGAWITLFLCLDPSLKNPLILADLGSDSCRVKTTFASIYYGSYHMSHMICNELISSYISATYCKLIYRISYNLYLMKCNVI